MEQMFFIGQGLIMHKIEMNYKEKGKADTAGGVQRNIYLRGNVSGTLCY